MAAKPATNSAGKKAFSVDSVFSDIGEFGRYQKLNLFLICTAAIVSSVPSFSYIFTTSVPTYRCKISECENNVTEFSPPWISRGIPVEGGQQLSHCYRHKVIEKNSKNQCTSGTFSSEIFKCNETDLVFLNDHTTIVNDFNIYCNENRWRLSLVGTLNSIGAFIGFPLVGIISDRFGRKKVLIGAIFLSAIIGMTKSFATSIEQFMFLETLDNSIGSTSYASSFVLGMEIVGPSYRVLACTVLTVSFACGEIIIGLIAWFTHSWRIFLRIIYLPGLFIFLYFWIIPESLRWLISKNKIDKAKALLETIASTNKRTLPEKSLLRLLEEEENQTEQQESKGNNLLVIFHHKILLLRFFNCVVAWMASYLLYYGLSLNAVSMPGGKYVNFICVAAAEIPAYLLNNFFLSTFGRRRTLFSAFLVASLSCTAFIFTPRGGYMQTIIFVLGKSAATVAFSAIYIFTSELFPTCIRHTIISYCAMLGCLGGMFAPQTPLLALIWTPLPLLIFGIVAFIAALLVNFLPETLNINLPDTIEDSENLSRSVRNKF